MLITNTLTLLIPHPHAMKGHPEYKCYAMHRKLEKNAAAQISNIFSSLSRLPDRPEH
jgi:hypothetical protein